MDLTLDYNIELFPLQDGQSFALALASTLSRAPQGAAGAEDEDKDRDVWRPDAKGRRGLDDEYEYVMYGKVSRAPRLTSRPTLPPSPRLASLVSSALLPYRYSASLSALSRSMLRFLAEFRRSVVPQVYRFDEGSAEIV